MHHEKKNTVKSIQTHSSGAFAQFGATIVTEDKMNKQEIRAKLFKELVSVVESVQHSLQEFLGHVTLAEMARHHTNSHTESIVGTTAAHKSRS